MMNAAVRLFPNINEIPNRYATLLFSLTTESGTYNAAAEAFQVIFSQEANFLKNVSCSILKGRQVKKSALTKALQTNCAIVLDVSTGGHSVLITKYDSDKKVFHIFDPDWKNISERRAKGKGWECSTTKWERHNIEISAETLFDGNGIFSMGKQSSWFAIILKLNRKK